MTNILDTLSKTAYKTVYIVDHSLLTESPSFSDQLSSIGTWFTSSGQRWMCHSDLPEEEFKQAILDHILTDDKEKVKFFKDSLPFSGNQEIEF